VIGDGRRTESKSDFGPCLETDESTVDHSVLVVLVKVDLLAVWRDNEAVSVCFVQARDDLVSMAGDEAMLRNVIWSGSSDTLALAALLPIDGLPSSLIRLAWAREPLFPPTF
jgi:hypothetical protein